MSELPEKPTEQKPTHNQQAVDDLLWDIPFARPIWNFFVREGKAVKNGWVAVAIMVGISIWITHSKTEGDIDAKLSGITNYFNGEISGLKGQLSEVRQDRDKYQLMLAPFQAMAIEKYTNAPLDQRLDLLSQGMASITNVLSGMNIEKPNLQLAVNGIILTNVDNAPGAVFSTAVNPILDSRDILIQVRNRSKTTAQSITVDFMAAIDSTNLMADGWHPQPGDGYGRQGWTIVSDFGIPQYRAFQANLIKILPSFKGKTLLVIIYVSADNSTISEYPFNIVFKE